VTRSTRRAIQFLALSSVVLSVSACGLPRSGPNRGEIIAGSVLKEGDAFVAAVDSRVTRIANTDSLQGFSSDFRNAGLVGSDIISPGDVLSLTIYENVRDDPLMGNTGQRVSQLQQLIVDGQGFIFVPYAGRIQAAGQTPEGLRQLITRKLDTQTPEPQIMVARKAGDGATVTVSGAVAGQGVFPIELPTRTLAAMLAKAGGVAIEPATAIVRVTRGSKQGSVWMQDLYDNPDLDIPLRSGDVIVVERDRRSYTALGATGAQQFVQFETPTLTAIEALATVGGLSSNLADPKGIFIFRNEKEGVARQVLGRNDLIGEQRLIYILDLTQPGGIFEAREFQIRDGDTVYVTEAPFVQWQKTINAITGTANSVNSLADAANGNN
jgi:polysaccharide biosynthesis/export protein